MPESKVRKSAVVKKRRRASDQPKKTPRAPGSRRWVAPAFITVGLLGVAWLVVYYIAGTTIPLMADLGNWNILIGMSGMTAAFILATLWK